MLTRNPDQRPNSCQCLKDIWFYSAHEHNHKKQGVGSLKVIKDDAWKEFETCDQFQTCNEKKALYEPLIGSLRFIDVDSDSVSANEKTYTKPYQPFIRKMSQDMYFIDTEFEELNSASSIHSLKMRTTMRASGFF